MKKTKDDEIIATFKYFHAKTKEKYISLVRVTPPAISIARTSRRRNKKKSHLFFWIK